MVTTEDRLVKKMAAALGSTSPRKSLRLGIGDDAALYRPTAGREIILTCDWFLEGSHFLRETDPPDSVGWKCLVRAVSDIAAMGGKPKVFLLSFALPETHTGPWLTHFLRGLRRAARYCRCQLAGGDTTRRKEILINITVIGEVPAGQALRRSGAEPGDLIFVSGSLGRAEFGLRALRRGQMDSAQAQLCIQKHLYPEPRLLLGQWLARNRIASAMMDLSDGLSTDLPRLCAASDVGARIEATNIPAVKLPASKQALSPLELALNGGDDYELLFTSHPGKARHVPRRLGRIPLTCIGQITRGREVLFFQADGPKKTMLPRGWDPFRK